MFHLDQSTIAGLLIGAVLWGALHGLTPHAHSWLVLLPFALGGIKRGAMLRIALSFALGMLITAMVTGALLGALFSLIPEGWHRGIELGIGGLLIMVGIIFMVKPLSVHHAIDHMCDEHCQPGGAQTLLRSGTAGGMFLFGAMSMVLPCPTNLWLYALPAVAATPLTGALVFTVYAFVTGIVIVGIALALVSARSLVETLDQRGYRNVIMRLGGVLILAVGLWLAWMGSHPHEHGDDLHEPAGMHESLHTGE